MKPLKPLAVGLLTPLAWFAGWMIWPLRRLWFLAQARAAIGIDVSTVLNGTLHLLGTKRVSIGGGGYFYRDIHLETQAEGSIRIGDRVVISSGVHIVSFFAVRIGKGTLIGEYSSIRDANHRTGKGGEDPRGGSGYRDSGHDGAPIEIGDNVWLGRGVCVLPGVSIGDGAVIGANSVVTRSVPARALAVGAPAKVVKTDIGDDHGAPTGN